MLKFLAKKTQSFRQELVLLHIFLQEFWSKRHLYWLCHVIAWEWQIYIFSIWIFDNSNDWASSHALLVKIPNWQKQGALYAKYIVCVCYKVHIFWEGHKILWKLHLTFVLCSDSQK
jgi:hypothetical protein